MGEVSPAADALQPVTAADALQPVTAADLVAWGMPERSAYRHLGAAHRSGEFATTEVERVTAQGDRRRVRAVLLTAAQIAATRREIAAR